MTPLHSLQGRCAIPFPRSVRVRLGGDAPRRADTAVSHPFHPTFRIDPLASVGLPQCQALPPIPPCRYTTVRRRGADLARPLKLQENSGGYLTPINLANTVTPRSCTGKFGSALLGAPAANWPPD